MIGYLITEWTKLRIQTILWDVSRNDDLKEITLHDKILSGGKAGKRHYFFEAGLVKKSDKEKLSISKKIHEIEAVTGNKMEIVALDPHELANLALYVRVDAEPKPKRTDALMQSLAMEKFQVYAARPDVFNLNAAAIKLAQAWGDDPDELILAKKETPQGQQQPGTEAASPAPAGQQGPGMMQQAQGGLIQQLGLPAKGAPALA
jgi:hypothetical protein